MEFHSKDDIEEIQILEHNLRNTMTQKQSFEMELNEILNAIEEVGKTKDDLYKITGQIMIKSNKEKILTDLEEKKNLLKLRLASLEKQEKLIDSKLESLKTELKKKK